MDGRDGATTIECSNVTSAMVFICSAVSLASPRLRDRAIVKAAGVGGSNQLLGIAASLSFETTGETIGIGFQSAGPR
jgi:hypothetical protein